MAIQVARAVPSNAPSGPYTDVCATALRPSTPTHSPTTTHSSPGRGSARTDAATRPSTYRRPGPMTDQPPAQSSATHTASSSTPETTVHGAAVRPSPTGPGNIRNPSLPVRVGPHP